MLIKTHCCKGKNKFNTIKFVGINWLHVFFQTLRANAALLNFTLIFEDFFKSNFILLAKDRCLACYDTFYLY